MCGTRFAVIAPTFSIMILKRTCSFLPSALRYTTKKKKGRKGKREERCCASHPLPLLYRLAIHIFFFQRHARKMPSEISQVLIIVCSMPPTHNSHEQRTITNWSKFSRVTLCCTNWFRTNPFCSVREIHVHDHNCQHSQTLASQVTMPRAVLSGFVPSSFQKSKCVAAGFSKHAVVWQQALELLEIANSLVIFTSNDKWNV